MTLNESRVHQIISEELNKADVTSIVNNKISSTLSSREFKQKVKELSSEVIYELFKILYQRSSTWKNSIARA